jgi:shikimate dehydrogenase
MTDSFRHEIVGVFGDPVDENPTIAMFDAAFTASGLKWRYQNFRVTADALADAMRGLRAMNFAGINCTIPHKVAVLQHLDKITPEAALMGAVNTVINRNGELIGTNTDGKGFMMSLRLDAKMDPKDKRIVILGAGGAARAIAVELAQEGAGHITIVNRTTEHGQGLVDLLNDKTNTKAEFAWWLGDYTMPAETDILVNATNIGLAPDLNARPAVDMNSITRSMLVCDVIPNPPRTRFLIEATGRGAKTLDGLGMLVYQGAIAFTLWTGKDAPIAQMKEALSTIFS